MFLGCGESEVARSFGCDQSCAQQCSKEHCSVGCDDECLDIGEIHRDHRPCTVTCTVHRVVIRGVVHEGSSLFSWLPGQSSELVVEIDPWDKAADPKRTGAGHHTPAHGDEQVWIWGAAKKATKAPKGEHLKFEVYTTTQLVVRALMLEQRGWLSGSEPLCRCVGEVKFLPVVGLHGALFLPLATEDGQATGMVMLTVNLHCEGELKPRRPLIAPSVFDLKEEAVEPDAMLPTWHMRGSRLQHEGGVTCCAVFPDGRRAVTGCRDSTAVIWSTNDTHQILRLEGHVSAVLSCAICPQGDKVVTGAAGEGIIWDASDGSRLASLPGFSCCAPFPMGDRILLGGLAIAGPGQKGAIYLNDGSLQVTLKAHSDRIMGCAVLDSGDLVLTVSKDKEAILWTDGGDVKYTLRGHSAPIVACAVFPKKLQGVKLVTASEDKTAIIWSAKDGRMVATLTGHEGPVTACAVVLDGAGVVTVSTDKLGILWSADGERLADLQGHTDAISRCVAFGSRRDLVATGSQEGMVYVWELTGPNQLIESARMSATLRRHTKAVADLAASPNNDFLLTVSQDSTGSIWNVPAREKSQKLRDIGFRI
mmetsp:Transcript_113102/g.243658  ORF Transcript_113102/g.243658 Transcript_113102/m.243658 type:complete len:591 (+) Transcript_113102:1-1773(+)